MPPAIGGYERLSKLCAELFNLQISEGALANLLCRVAPDFDAQVQAILTRLRRSRIVCSDETGARVKGRNAWEWVFQNHELSVHVIRNSRAAAVAEEVMAGHKPAIWVSDLYSAQRGHGERWQICLAHQLRDCQYAKVKDTDRRRLLSKGKPTFKPQRQLSGRLRRLYPRKQTRRWTPVFVGS